MRRCGREPSRLDLAAHFASAASEKADAEPLVGKVRALGGSGLQLDGGVYVHSACAQTICWVSRAPEI